MSNSDIVDVYGKRKTLTRVRLLYPGRYLPWPDHPIGCPDGILLISNETAEKRAFRRFPITSHKPALGQ